MYLLQDGRKISKKKTAVKRGDTNPVFNEAMIFSVPAIVLQVWPSMGELGRGAHPRAPQAPQTHCWGAPGGCEGCGCVWVWFGVDVCGLLWGIGLCGGCLERCGCVEMAAGGGMNVGWDSLGGYGCVGWDLAGSTGLVWYVDGAKMGLGDVG